MDENQCAKIALKINESLDLVTVNKDMGLKSCIETLIAQFDLPPNKNYGLKVLDSKMHSRNNMYVTEQTFIIDLQDGNKLEIVPSIEEFVNRICSSSAIPEEKSIHLYNLATDPAFIDALVQTNREHEVLNFLKNNELDDSGKSGCLMTLLKLLQGDHLKTIEDEILDKVITNVKNKGAPSQYALSVLAQILYIRDVELGKIKKTIIHNLSMSDLIPLIDMKCNEFSLNTLLLINAIIKTVKDEKRESIIRELNTVVNKQTFFELMKDGHLNDSLAKQLYILQTFLLSPYMQTLCKIVGSSTLEFDSNNRNYEDEMSGFTFEQDEVLTGAESMLSLYKDNVSRYSIASIATTRSSFSGELPDPASFISQLTYNCILYYKAKHFQNFCKSQSEENTYEPGICRSSERVVQMIAQVLNIGQRIQKSGCKMYLPVYFNQKTSNFVEELYVVTMYLLSKGRKEMNVKRMEDYEKLMMVLKKQLLIILERKPSTIQELQGVAMKMNYDIVKDQWQKEREAEWLKTLEKNPCIIELARSFDKKNTELMMQQRMKVLCEGDVFPKLPEKKHKSQHFLMKLTTNYKYLLVSDWNPVNQNISNTKTFHIEHIRHFVTGAACPSIKENMVDKSKHMYVFSLMFSDDVTLNCVAAEVKKANYWIDGFHLLLDKPNRSKDYMQELSNLTQMDCALHLIELQNIKIPSLPPPIPPLVATRPSPRLPPKTSRCTSRTQSQIYMDRASFE